MIRVTHDMNIPMPWCAFWAQAIQGVLCVRRIAGQGLLNLLAT